MKSEVDKLLNQHNKLIHSEDKKVVSHTQRETGDWIMHAIMLDGYDVPFKFKRKKKYRSLAGAKVNLTYYPATEIVAGLSFEVMKVVRIKRA